MQAMFNRDRIIKAGDLVIMYESISKLWCVYAKPGESFQNSFGKFRHDDIIGKPFGSKARASNNSGWVYMLRPTPELWTAACARRTQILYSTDIALIVLYLDLKPGRIVLESGTGSGSLTHSLARAVAPSGLVHTMEYNAERCAAAENDFKKNGIADVVRITHRDVCKTGFGRPIGEADAVFLDVPSPWDVSADAFRSLKIGGRLCSFSPCIEQVQRSALAFAADGFCEVSSFECLIREFLPANIELETVAAPAPSGPREAKRARIEPSLSAEADGEAEPADHKAALAETAAQVAAPEPEPTDAVGMPTRARTRHYVVAKAVADMRGHTGFLSVWEKPPPVGTK